jgi:regulator of sirC expression with transglutaminase-like and TPR domain
MTSPAYCRPLAYDALRRELPQIATQQGLVRAACAVASHESGLAESTQVLESLDAMVQTVRNRAPSDSPSALVAHLHDVLFDLLEFSGNQDDYYNTANSYLPAVLSSRRGIPITLAIVYKYVASELGLSVHGINSPGHFLVAVELIEGGNPTLMFVDPFYGGQLLSLPEAFKRISETTGKVVEPDPRLLAPASHQAWIARLLLNLTAIFARTGREKDLYAMQEMLDLVEREYVA